MTDKALVRHEAPDWTEEQQRIIREQFADGCTDDELLVLLYQARRRGLDPLLGQIRGIKRWNAAKGREVMAIQTSIDGFRVIAERTGCYGGGPAPEFRVETDDKGNRDLVCRFTVRKLCGNAEAGWQWLDVTDEARFSEYVVRTKQGKPVAMWQQKAHIMLAKCAEAKTLRRAFPEDLSGLYTDDEMAQADNPVQSESASQPHGAAGEAATTGPARPPAWRCEMCRKVLDEEFDDLPRLLCADHAAKLDASKREAERPDENPTYHTPDKHQRERFKRALFHDPNLTEGVRAEYVHRGGTCETARDFDRLCDELEGVVGLDKRERGPDGLPISGQADKPAPKPEPAKAAADGDLPF